MAFCGKSASANSQSEVFLALRALLGYMGAMLDSIFLSLGLLVTPPVPPRIQERSHVFALPSEGEGPSSDWANLRGDWLTVGEDLRKASLKVTENVEKATDTQ